jgi:hypothetical protein
MCGGGGSGSPKFGNEADCKFFTDLVGEDVLLWFDADPNNVAGYSLTDISTACGGVLIGTSGVGARDTRIDLSEVVRIEVV